MRDTVFRGELASIIFSGVKHVMIPDMLVRPLGCTLSNLLSQGAHRPTRASALPGTLCSAT